MWKCKEFDFKGNEYDNISYMSFLRWILNALKYTLCIVSGLTNSDGRAIILEDLISVMF